MHVEFRILGPLEVWHDGRELELGSGRQRALLLILLLHRGAAVSVDRLIDELWGERPPATAMKVVHNYISQLRRALPAETILTRDSGYLVRRGATDVDEVERLLRDARAQGAREAAETLRGALALWRGPPLADVAYDAWAQAEIARLDELRLTALEERIDADLRLGRAAQLVPELEARVREHPLREGFRAQLMLALYRSGRQAEALTVFSDARTRFVDELGIEPGPDLQELQRKILAHDPELGPVRGPLAQVARRASWLVLAGGILVTAAGVTLLLTHGGGSHQPIVVTGNTLATIDPARNRVSGAVLVGVRPGPIAYGSGSLWVANLDDQTVQEIDPRTLRVVRTQPVGEVPTGLAASAGAVWVVGAKAGQPSVSVQRIDPLFHDLASVASLPSVTPGSGASIAAEQNALWVAPSSGLLSRLDPHTGRVLRRIDPNAGPSAVALGAGAVWFTDFFADTLTRVGAAGTVASIAVGQGPSGVAVGAGAVWVADSLDNTIMRVDPVSRRVTATIPVGATPVGVSVGAGSVWVADSGDGTVTRIDPTTNRVERTIVVGGSPQAITIAAGRIWITVQARIIGSPTRPASGGTARVNAVGIGFADRASPAYWQIRYATCAKLVNYPDAPVPDGSRLIPELARTLPIRSADGKTYTFTIRKGFRFSSGAPVTAQTVKYTIEWNLNPKFTHGDAGFLADIVGARAYASGRATDLTGVQAHGSTLTIHLLAPVPDLLSRVEQSTCVVPVGTPFDPGLYPLNIPSAGPYYVSSYTPGQGVVLERNPHYGGRRPRRLDRIELTLRVSRQRSVAEIKAGTADYAADGVPRGDQQALNARYGPDSKAAKDKGQEYFVDPFPEVDFLVLNTHRPLFRDARLRRAVNYAIDRRALARLGSPLLTRGSIPTEDYLPPGIPGYRNVHPYPFTPDLRAARRLAAGAAGKTAVLYTCNYSNCLQIANIVRRDLHRIGITVRIEAFSEPSYFNRIGTGEPYDLALAGWIAGRLDPSEFLNALLSATEWNLPTLDDPLYQHRLSAAERLSGTRRDLAYAQLDAQLVRDAAPLVAWGNAVDHDFFSARIGCQIYQPIYGIDLAALCIKKP